MSEWRRVKLGEICESISDGDHLSPPKCDSGVPFATISDIRNNRFDLLHITRFVPESYFDEIDAKRKIRKGDILYSVVGSYGIPVYAKQDLRLAFQRHIAILRPGNSLVPRFLYYAMLDTGFYKRAENVAVGAAQKTISLTSLRGLEIELPPLPIQRRIADYLLAYDDLIENNRRRIEILEETARTVFQRILDESDGAAVSAGDIVEVNPAVPRPGAKSIRYVPMSALSTAGMTINFEEIEIRSSSTSIRFQNGDVLLARITPCLENGKTAFVGFLDDGETACGSSEFIVMRGRRVSPYFTYCLARLDAFRAIAIKSMVGASGRQRVQPSCFDDFTLRYPDKEALAEFDKIVAPMFGQITILVKQNAKLAAARDLLLPRLMSGKLEVSS